MNQSYNKKNAIVFSDLTILTLKHNEKERLFLKKLLDLKDELSFLKAQSTSEFTYEELSLVVIQLEIFWYLKKHDFFGIKDEIQLFFSEIMSDSPENNFPNLLKLLNEKKFGSFFVFDFKIEKVFHFKIFFEKIFRFLESNNDEGLFINGYFIGLTYESFMYYQQRNKTGSFYTPKTLAGVIAKKVIDDYLKFSINEKFNLYKQYESITFPELKKAITPEQKRFLIELLGSMTIFDPSMGTGNFLVEAFEYLLSLFGYFSLEKMKNRLFYLSHAIFGIDINVIPAKITKIRLLFILMEQDQDFFKNSEKDLLFNIKTANSITNLPPLHQGLPFDGKSIQQGFSIILSNPPHGAKLDDEIKKESKKYFKTVSGFQKEHQAFNDRKITKGNPNSAVLFTEICGSLLSKNGFCGIILPKSLLYIEAWESIRYYLTHNMRLISILDLQKGFESVLLEQIICIFKEKGINTFIKHADQKLRLEEFNDDFNLVLKRSIDSKYLTYNKLLITITDQNYQIYNQIQKAPQLRQYDFKSHRGLIVSKYLEQEPTKSTNPILKGKDIQPFYIRNISYCPKTLIQEKPYLKYGTLMIQRIIAHVLNPAPHIILTVALNPGIPTVDTVVNIYSTKYKEEEFKVLAMYLNSELVNWYAYHFVYCEAIRSMDIFGYYLNQIPVKSLDDYKNELIIIFEYLTILKTIKHKENHDSKSIDELISFMEDLGNSIIYFLFFKDTSSHDSLVDNYFKSFKDSNFNFNHKIKINFDNWYRNEQFQDINDWTLNKNLFMKSMESLTKNTDITQSIQYIEEHPWVKTICKEFRK